jgi:hypothetical protein
LGLGFAVKFIDAHFLGRLLLLLHSGKNFLCLAPSFDFITIMIESFLGRKSEWKMEAAAVGEDENYRTLF